MRFCDEQLTNISSIQMCGWVLASMTLVSLCACVRTKSVCVCECMICVTSISFHVDFVNLNYSFDTVNEFESLTYRKYVFFRIYRAAINLNLTQSQLKSTQSIDRPNYVNKFKLLNQSFVNLFACQHLFSIFFVFALKPIRSWCKNSQKKNKRFEMVFLRLK